MTLSLPVHAATPPALMVWCPGEPVAWMRAGIAPKGGGRVVHFTPHKLRKWEQHVHVCAREAIAFSSWPRSTPEDRYSLEIELHFATGRRRDWDNCAKAICDAFNGVVWVDDWQVVACRIRRFLKSPQPGVRAYVRPAKEVYGNGK